MSEDFSDFKAADDFSDFKPVMSREDRIAALKKNNPGEYDSTSKEWQDRNGPTSGTSFLQNLLAGTGKSIVDTGRGLKQLALEASRPFGGNTAADQYRQQIDEAHQLDAPLMKTGGGLTGYVGGTLATGLLPAGAIAKGAELTNLARTANIARAVVNPNTYAAAAASGAIQGAIQPVGADESRLMNTGIGAAGGIGGQALSRTIGRIAQPVKNALTPTDQRAVNALQSADVPLDTAQQTGSNRLMQMKRFLADNPITANAQVDQAAKTSQGFTTAVLKQIGEKSSIADEKTLGQASRRIGKSFDDIAERNPIAADDPLLTKLSEIEQQSSSELQSSQAKVIQNQINEIIDKASGGSIDGKAYQNTKSILDRLTNGADPGIKHYAGQIRSALDDALQRSASPDDAAALKVARTQYRNLRTMIDGKAVGPDENVNPSKLYNAFNVKKYGGSNSLATGIGQNDLMSLAKAGKRIIPERQPNSGTAPRAALQLLLPGAIGAGYGYAKEGDVSGAAKYGLGGVLAPKLLQQALNRPQIAGYLTNGLSGTPRKLLTADETRLLLQQLPKAYRSEAAQQQ